MPVLHKIYRSDTTAKVVRNRVKLSNFIVTYCNLRVPVQDFDRPILESLNLSTQWFGVDCPVCLDGCSNGDGV